MDLSGVSTPQVFWHGLGGWWGGLWTYLVARPPSLALDLILDRPSFFFESGGRTRTLVQMTPPTQHQGPSIGSELLARDRETAAEAHHQTKKKQTSFNVFS